MQVDTVVSKVTTTLSQNSDAVNKKLSETADGIKADTAKARNLGLLSLPLVYMTTT